MTILVGCPCQNREEVMEDYLDSIYHLNYPKDQIRLAFLVNNSTDETEDIIWDFFDKHGGEYAFAALSTEVNTDYVDSIYHRDFKEFAKIRNMWVSGFLAPSDTHVFSVDSDVLIPPHTLRHLLYNDKDICSVLVENAPSFYNIANYDERAKCYKSCYGFPRSLFTVDVTGAAMLIKREVFDSGIWWWGSRQGEDISFCEGARMKRFNVYCDASIEAKHLKWTVLHKRSLE